MSSLWAVLIAGEHHGVAKLLGGHSSINQICDAYKTLRNFLPRERIIVIAQLSECARWHEMDYTEKVKGIDDPKRIEAQRVMWEERKLGFYSHAKQLLDEGGADYDGELVNPDTVLRVLRGEPSELVQRVVEYSEYGPKTRVFVSMFSHGNWNGEKENHYFFMPYPSNPIFESMMRANRPPNPPPKPPPVPLDQPVVTPTEQTTSSASASVQQEVVAVVTNSIDTSSTSNSPSSRSQTSEVLITPEGVITATLPAPAPSAVVITTTAPEAVPEAATDTGSTTVPEEVTTGTTASERSDPSEVLVPLEGIEDQMYLNIASYLPLSGDARRPVRVFIPRIIKEKEPEKSIEEMNREDASLLHWQYVFEALRHVFTVHKPESMFIFMQSCGSGGMWKWLKGNEVYEREYQCPKWPLFVGYTAEPETSAVGASWAVFFSALSRTLLEHDTAACHACRQREREEREITTITANIHACQQREREERERTNIIGNTLDSFSVSVDGLWDGEADGSTSPQAPHTPLTPSPHTPGTPHELSTTSGKQVLTTVHQEGGPDKNHHDDDGMTRPLSIDTEDVGCSIDSSSSSHGNDGSNGNSCSKQGTPHSEDRQAVDNVTGGSRSSSSSSLGRGRNGRKKDDDIASRSDTALSCFDSRDGSVASSSVAGLAAGSGGGTAEGIGAGNTVTGTDGTGFCHIAAGSHAPCPRHLTLARFYERVCERYYHVEPTIFRINFELSEEERKQMLCARFGVLGTACGRESCVENLTLRDFFLE